MITNEKARIKLAEAMGLDPNDTTDMDVSGSYHPAFTPFTDANDERALFRHMMEQPFSVRRKFFREYDRILDENHETEYFVAWPDKLMFAKDGDIARAALKVIDDAPD